MGVSQEKSKSGRASSATVASSQFLFHKILYCGALLVALLTCVVCLAASVEAQEERPQITPGERKVPRKKDAGPRAVAVLQLSANGKASLVPIAILVDGKFWDATAYKANPVPMALDSGTVYEAMHTGTSKGLFTVGSALHSNSANAPTPWIGTGNWVAAGTEVAKTTHSAETVPVGIDTSDQAPRLTKNPAAKTAPPANPTPPASTPSQPSGTSDSGDGPPRLKKPEAPPAGSTPADPSKPAPDSTAPSTDSKTGDAKPADRANVATSDSGASEANRPRLRRGKPAESFGDEEVPGYSKPGTAPLLTPANAAKGAEAAGDKGPVQLVPAISDANGPEPHSYTFGWLKDEEGERKQQMTTYAKEQIRAYVEARAKSMITPTAPGTPTAKRKVAAKLPEPILENVQMIAYDLWTNGQPVLVFAADAHMPPPAPGITHAPADTGLEYTIMVVARTDIYNNLHKLFLAVTDKNHLDLTPRYELIDAVDADGDGRGELLFRETSDVGTGWILYRASADKLWKMFDSLNRE
jgi:hypothetical protein